MEAFKFAFETIIVGLLALPWLFVMVDLIQPEVFTSTTYHGISILELVPKELQGTLASVFLLSFAYFLGSAVSPLASEFLNDEDWVGFALPTEEDIRASVTCENNQLMPGINKPNQKYLSGLGNQLQEKDCENLKRNKAAKSFNWLAKQIKFKVTGQQASNTEEVELKKREKLRRRSSP